MSQDTRALAWALAAILLWGTLAAVVGDALEGAPPSQLVLWAFVFSAPTLALVDLARGRKLAAIFRAPGRVVALGLWGIFVYHALLFTALDRAPHVEANLLNYLWPLLMVLLAAPIAGERPTRVVLLGALVGFVGAALVVTRGEGLHVESEHALGYGLAALAAFAWASFSVVLRRLGPEGEDRMTLFTVASLVPAVAFAALTGGLAPPSGRALAAAAWLGVGPMGVAFFCWNRALALGSAARIGSLSYLTPLLSTLALAALARGGVGSVSRVTWVGMALIVGGAAGPVLWERARGARA